MRSSRASPENRSGYLCGCPKKSFIRAKGYPSIPFDAALAKAKAGSGWKTFEMTAGHDAMVDQPQELTDLLLQVA